MERISLLHMLAGFSSDLEALWVARRLKLFKMPLTSYALCKLFNLHGSGLNKTKILTYITMAHSKNKRGNAHGHEVLFCAVQNLVFLHIFRTVRKHENLIDYSF